VTPWWWTLRGPKHVGVYFRVLNLNVLFYVVVSFIRTTTYIKGISGTLWRSLRLNYGRRYESQVTPPTTRSSSAYDQWYVHYSSQITALGNMCKALGPIPSIFRLGPSIRNFPPNLASLNLNTDLVWWITLLTWKHQNVSHCRTN
jgi:hypothetical protein